MMKPLISNIKPREVMKSPALELILIKKLQVLADHDVSVRELMYRENESDSRS